MHFETIWNAAELVAKNYIDLERKKIVRSCRSALDDLVDADNQEEYHKALGDLLFGLCSFCASTEKNEKIQINSAIALSNSISRKREEILDSDNDIE